MKKLIKITESQAKKLLKKIVKEQYHNVGGGNPGVGKSFDADEMAEQQTGSKFNPLNGYKPPVSKISDIKTKDGKYVIRLSDTNNVKSIQSAITKIGKIKTLTIAGKVTKRPEIESALKTFVSGSGIDGIYGQGTKNAVIMIQRILKLPTTGFVNTGLAKILSDSTGIPVKSMFVPVPQQETSVASSSTAPTEFNSSLHPDLQPIQESIKKQLELLKK